MSICLQSRVKGHTRELDKLHAPEQTVEQVRTRFAQFGADILADTRRIDTGRLGIPVFMSMCGPKAKEVMPTRKQMGKGATPAQAQASALMELAERYSFFRYWRDLNALPKYTWSEAEARWPGTVLPIGQILQSVDEQLPEELARELMDLLQWHFVPVTRLDTGQECMAPLEWFKKINEFNGSSAGNCPEESILQGVCELVERHVCALADRGRLETPSLDAQGFDDPVLRELWAAFASQGVHVLLKDFSLGLPVPTVAALAHDPATFPEHSEIVFTAGTATTPAKAAIRALTEIAQLAGDFETRSNYEASGLPKFTDLDQTAWLRRGPLTGLDTLPDLGSVDIYQELTQLCGLLAASGHQAYSADITDPVLAVPAHYSFIPGFQFRERARNPSMGLFIGRVLAEDADCQEAFSGLQRLSQIYEGAAFPLFFQGLAAMRQGDLPRAVSLLARGEQGLDDPEDQALAAFYQGYALTRGENWQAAITHLDRAIALCPDVKEYFNLRGVARFKLREYSIAELDFQQALDLDGGSAMDWANMGLCAKYLGRRDEAARMLQTALSLDPGLEFATTHLRDLHATLERT
jgi:ribosomal protein S12 methylthiotransferase accessory factor